ncbi:Calx-beta domain-containing protein [Caenimonas sp. SL110]|uniref:beta strand repeat-containing protein n=1 Tax=Caenimonas sp. SL110 TaxID=1450524 RepID=UPI000652A124|nr:Calx-beta domain-containing protein [Caenimonas sp. SL110]
MAITAAERHEIAEIIVLMFDAAPGATYLAQLISAYQSVGNNLDTLTDLVADHPNYAAVHTSIDTDAEWTYDLLATVELQDDPEATDRIINALNDGISKGDITFALYQFLNMVLADPEAEATYGPQYIKAAEILDNKADVAIYFSVTKGIASTNLAELQGALDGVDETDASVDAAQDAIDVQYDPQSFNLTIDAPTVTEGDAGTKILTFTLTLLDLQGDATVGSTTVNYSTANGTASSGDDYQAAAGQVTFAPGQTQATVSVTILGDETVETNETILLNVTGATLVAPAQGTGTIVNNDVLQMFSASITSPSVTEGDAGTTLMSFVITLGSTPTRPVSFTYATVNAAGAGVATAGDDYIATSGTVSFVAGQTSATVSVVINGDMTPELAETLALTLTGAQLNAAVTGTGTVLNDDTDFDLTPELDDLTTSPFDDVINGTELTFTLGDEIDGGDGFDTLKLVFDGPDGVLTPAVILAPFIEVSDVESVEITSDLSVGEDGGNTFDMSDWVGVEEINIRTAGNADVNVESNASGSVVITTMGGNVTLSDNTVDEVIVDADDSGDVYIQAYSATSIEAMGEDVHVDASDADITAIGNGYVQVHADDGNFTVEAGGSAEVDVGDAATLSVESGGWVDVVADTIGSGDVTADEWVSIEADTIGEITATGNLDGQSATVTVVDAVEWASDNELMMDDDVNIDIGEDGDVDVSAGTIDSVDVTGGDEVTIIAGEIGSVSLTAVDNYESVTISQYSDTSLDLTVSDSYIDTLTIDQATTELNLVSTGSDSVSDDGSYIVVDGDTTVETVNLTGAADLYLDIEDVEGVLTTINGGDFTGDLTLYALGAIDVTSGTGDDYVIVGGGSDEDVSVDAGEGDNYVDVNQNGVVVITTGEGDDDVTVNLDALANEGSFVAIGGGDNTLRLRSFDPITDEDLDAFDETPLPLSGTVQSLWFAAQVDLSDDSESTLDVGGLDGPVSFIGFGDVDVNGDVASLTIDGTGPELSIYSSDDFGGDMGGTLVFEAVGVTDLDIEVEEDADIQIMGDDLVNLDVYTGEDLSLVIDGDTNSDDVIDQLEALETVTLEGSDVDVEIQNARSGFSLVVATTSDDSDVYISISDAEVGNVTVDFGSDGASAELDINGTFESTVVVGTIDINDNAIAFSDDYEADGGSTIDIEVSDNDFSMMTIGAITATADGDVDMSVSYNNHTTIDFGDISLDSRSESASLTIYENKDNEAGADAIINMGNVTVAAASDASLVIQYNSDSAITMLDVSVTSMFSDASVVVDGNSEATVDIGDVTIESGYGARAFMLISDNDAADVTVGNVTIDGGGSWSDGAFLMVALQDNASVEVGDVEITSGYDAWFSVYDNSDTDVQVGDVTVVASDNVWFDISDNTYSDITIGAVDLSTVSFSDNSYGGDVNVSISEGSNSDSMISIASFNIDAQDDVEFTISGVNNDDGEIDIEGDIVIHADDDVDFYMEEVESVGDITITAGEDIDFDLISVGQGGEVVSLSSTFEDVDALVSDVDLESLTIAAAGYADVEINWVSDSTFTLNIAEVDGQATVDASEADFDSSGALNTIMLGAGDVMYYNDLVNSGSDSDGVTDESRELFVFGTGAEEGVGDVVIENFRPGAFAANVGPNGDGYDVVWSDRLNFSELDGVTSLEDMTFDVVGADVVIDFVDPDYGSITLVGVAAEYGNATDLVQASIQFTAVA